MTHHSDSEPNGRSTDRIDSWKRVARYLGRSERTVRRWEAEDHLPIYRLNHGGTGSIYAFSHELDEWMLAHTTQPCVRAGDDLPTVCVEELLDLSADGSLTTLCKGLAEDLTSRLYAELGPHLRVLDSAHSNARASARVTFIVSGSVRSAECWIKIVLKLIRHADASVLKIAEFNQARGNLIDLTETVAPQAVQAFLPYLRDGPGRKSRPLLQMGLEAQ